MAGPYGSAFSGGYKRSPMAEALGYAGQAIGGGVERGVGNFVEGRNRAEDQKMQRDKMALEKDRYDQSRVDQVEQEYNAAIEAAKGDPDLTAEAERIRREKIEQIRPSPKVSPAKPAEPTQAAKPKGIASITTPQDQSEKIALQPDGSFKAVEPAQPTAPQPEQPKGIAAVVRPADFGQVKGEAKKREQERAAQVEAEKYSRQRRASLSDIGYEGYFGRVPGLPDPEALNTDADVNAAKALIVAWEKDRANKRAELSAAAQQNNTRASQMLSVMNGYDNDNQVTAATTDLNQADSALGLARLASTGDATAQSSFRRVMAAMMNRGALSDADVRDVVGDSNLDSFKKAVDRFIGGDEMALTKGQVESLKTILANKRENASQRLAARNEYWMKSVKSVVPDWTPPEVPKAPPAGKPGWKILKVEGK